MDKRRIDLLCKVVERYQYHNSQISHENPLVNETAKDMVDIDICEMWMLTQ